MEYHKTKDILHVKQRLGHKNINNTLRYTQLINLENDEYHVRVTITLKEAYELAEAGFDYFTIIEDAQIFRKRKKRQYINAKDSHIKSKNLGPVEDFKFQDKVEIREPKVENLDQLLMVRRESFKESGLWYSEPDGEAFKRGMGNRIGQDDVKVYVAVLENALLSYVVCSINKDNGEAADIRVICVLP